MSSVSDGLMARRTADVGAVLIRPSHRGTSTITIMIKVRNSKSGLRVCSGLVEVCLAQGLICS